MQNAATKYRLDLDALAVVYGCAPRCIDRATGPVFDDGMQQ